MGFSPTRGCEHTRCTACGYRACTRAGCICCAARRCNGPPTWREETSCWSRCAPRHNFWNYFSGPIISIRSSDAPFLVGAGAGARGRPDVDGPRGRMAPRSRDGSGHRGLRHLRGCVHSLGLESALRDALRRRLTLRRRLVRRAPAHAWRRRRLCRGGLRCLGRWARRRRRRWGHVR